MKVVKEIPRINALEKFTFFPRIIYKILLYSLFFISNYLGTEYLF